jgi:hypothetical protein
MKRRPPAVPPLANPFLAWTTFALKSAEMSTAAAQVIAMRVGRMMAAGANPTAADRREMVRMGAEKVDAFSRAGAALAAGMTPNAMAVGVRAVEAWAAMLGAGASLATAGTLPQAARRQRALVNAVARHAPAARQGSKAAATIAHAVLAPVHAKATANAKRLSRRK